MGTLIAILGVTGISQIFKGLVKKFGDTGMHLLVLAVCIVFSVAWAIIQANPSLMTMAQNAGILLLGAVSTYEIVWKQLATLIDSTPVDTSNTNATGMTGGNTQV